MIAWYYLVILSAIMSVMVSLVQKRALKREHATEYSAASSFLVAGASLIFLPFASFGMTPIELFFAIAFGILSSITLLIGTKVVRHGSISSVTPLSNVLPLFFTIVLAYFFLAETLSAIQIASVIGIAIVTYLMLFKRKRNPFKRDFESSKYKILLVANALIGSVGGIIGKYLLVNINVFSFLIITQLVASLCLLSFENIRYKGLGGVFGSIKKYHNTFLVLIILIIGLRVLAYFALTVAPVNIASTLSNAVFVMLTVPIGGVLFKEDDIKRKALMSFVILIFSYFLIAQ